jgi:hypothetical protein
LEWMAFTVSYTIFVRFSRTGLREIPEEVQTAIGCHSPLTGINVVR